MPTFKLTSPLCPPHPDYNTLLQRCCPTLLTFGRTSRGRASGARLPRATSSSSRRARSCTGCRSSSWCVRCCTHGSSDVFPLRACGWTLSLSHRFYPSSLFLVCAGGAAHAHRRCAAGAARQGRQCDGAHPRRLAPAHCGRPGHRKEPGECAREGYGRHLGFSRHCATELTHDFHVSTTPPLQFLQFAHKLMARSVMTTGTGTTSAGLTCAAVHDDGGWVLEAGEYKAAVRNGF